MSVLAPFGRVVNISVFERLVVLIPGLTAID